MSKFLATLAVAGLQVCVANQLPSHSYLSLLQQHVEKVQAGEAKALPEGYHTSDDLLDRVKSLADSGCTSGLSMTVETVKDNIGNSSEDGELLVVRLGEESADKRVMVVANEHARELITGEVALNFIETACVGVGDIADSLRQTLQKVRFTIVPVANVKGRKSVEDGSSTCQRFTLDEGEGEIDLNRNMDVDFEAGYDHGPSPFSAYQSRILADLAKSEKPLAYLDVHSGARSLMVSWGNREWVTPDYPDQSKLLEAVKTQWCQDCELGSNRIVIGYENPGEIIDHMYAKVGIKYSTLWEVWEGPYEANWTNYDCMSLFNPAPDELKGALKQWTGAMQTLGEFVDQHVSADEKSNPEALNMSSPPSGLEQRLETEKSRRTDIPSWVSEKDFITT